MTYLTEDEAANTQARWRLTHLLPADDPKQAIELPGSVSASKTAVSSSAAGLYGDIAGGYPSELGLTRSPILLPDSGGQIVAAILQDTLLHRGWGVVTTIVKCSRGRWMGSARSAGLAAFELARELV